MGMSGNSARAGARSKCIAPVSIQAPAPAIRAMNGEKGLAAIDITLSMADGRRLDRVVAGSGDERPCEFSQRVILGSPFEGSPQER